MNYKRIIKCCSDLSKIDNIQEGEIVYSGNSLYVRINNSFVEIPVESSISGSEFIKEINNNRSLFENSIIKKNKYYGRDKK